MHCAYCPYIEQNNPDLAWPVSESVTIPHQDNLGLDKDYIKYSFASSFTTYEGK